ncbi:glycoside hydrolase family 3 protein [Natronoglycomyces albus]|uniref:beta-N-acetylhexosaminidase n=1 Tax=Natronoglycomyces albus TaxID=2811108 RepID=A0A895XYZ6_9ACTN|nr:glycoside hydrolase family 3 protein [Natronoglycomyces albus]QSB06828.1 glycoside hydrolase family 3 C-terminal domain-containing protein [Natronoglycomyces albus]
MSVGGSLSRRGALFVAGVVTAVAVLVVVFVVVLGKGNGQGMRDSRSFDDGGDYVEYMVGQMSLEEKVGQLFMTYVFGDAADTANADFVAANQDAHGVDNADELFERFHVGGVIYFSWADNLGDPVQIAQLSNGIQDAAVSSGAGVPALISTDQEHGLITRIGDPVTALPGSMALGASGDFEDARLAAGISGQELAAMGLNYNFAPVADVNVNPANPVIGVRSFSSDPGVVAELTAAQVEGYRFHVAAAAKHFPGHGNTDVDSHVALPEITHDRQQWELTDLPPFAAAIEAGVDSIMSAHLRFPSLDASGTPATLSEPIMTGLLRDELGFDGVVVTDSLEMEGVRADYSDAQIPVKALQAGVDMLLMPADLEVAFDAVLDAVSSGELTEERIDESVARILRLKFDRGIVSSPMVNVDRVDAVVGSAKNTASAQDITDATTTLLSNEGVLPLDVDSGADVLVTGVGEDVTASLAEQFPARGVNAEALATGVEPSAEQIARAVAASEDADVVVVLTRNLRSSPDQVALVEALIGSGTDVVAVAVENPSDIAYMDAPGAAVATYATTASAVRSLAGVIFGERDATGRLPVDVVDAGGEVLFERGHGLSR